MINIKNIVAREILDSRGNPTVEVTLTTNKGKCVASTPSGASTGSHEAVELRDGGSRYNGKGVLDAVNNVNNKIRPLLVNKNISVEEGDRIMLELDGTKNKSVLGANAILPVSVAILRAEGLHQEKELHRLIAEKFNFTQSIPVPLFNIINGGQHGAGGVSFQEFMLCPERSSFADNLRYSVEFFHILKHLLKERYGAASANCGDEGGFVPKISSEEEVLKILNDISSDNSFVIDVASTEFFKDDKYHFRNGNILTTEEMINFYKEICQKFRIKGLEDPLHEDDFTGWSRLGKELSSKIIIGDDLLVTNTERMEQAKQHISCNAMILKINQIGSITEAVKAAKKAKEWGWKIIVSHRSGETNDDFIADFAVGIGAEYIKSGAPQRGERVVKYNRLLQIENS